MDRNNLNMYLCAILTTLAEVDFAPESALYLGIGADFGTWQTLRSILLAGGLATVEGHAVTITPKGRAVADKVTAHNASQRAA